jgi:hypothetical protein
MEKGSETIETSMRTVQSPVSVLRAQFTGGASAESDLTATTRLKANIPSHAFGIDIRWNAIELTFASDAAGQDAVATVYLARNNSDPVKAFTTGTLTSGAQKNTPGEFLVDTGSIATQHWIKTVVDVDGGASDQVYRISLDAGGYEKIFVLWTTIANGEKWTSYISGF